MPEIRPFRALRYDPAPVGDLAAVISPPYDVISPEMQARLLARHPRNIVRLDLPADEPGDAPDEKYRRAARTYLAWRGDGTLRKDPHPAIYLYEQAYRLPGAALERVQRGFFARLRLEPPGPGSGVLPHERTLAGPREDRYRLLRATGANLSPIVVFHHDASAHGARAFAEAASGEPEIDVCDDEGVRHRLWVVPAEGPASQAVTTHLESAASGPLTIADGHHRYETALRYRTERRANAGCFEDPAFDYVLALILDAADTPPTVLPTHRLVLGPADGTGADEPAILARAEALFEVEPTSTAKVEARFSPGSGAVGGAGRFGLLTRSGSYLLTARWERLESLLDAGASGPMRRLDVTFLQAALRPLFGIDAAATTAGGRLRYTIDASEAARAVAAGEVVAAILLEPTPVADVAAVAAAGDVMPQKSTYFYPKPASGLVINAHEW